MAARGLRHPPGPRVVGGWPSSAPRGEAPNTHLRSLANFELVPIGKPPVRRSTPEAVSVRVCTPRERELGYKVSESPQPSLAVRPEEASFQGGVADARVTC